MIEVIARALDSTPWDTDCTADDHTKETLKRWAREKARIALKSLRHAPIKGDGDALGGFATIGTPREIWEGIIDDALRESATK
jgi:hypothetical protein